jgi:hypothetical protein
MFIKYFSCFAKQFTYYYDFVGKWLCKWKSRGIKLKKGSCGYWNELQMINFWLSVEKARCMDLLCVVFYSVKYVGIGMIVDRSLECKCWVWRKYNGWKGRRVIGGNKLEGTEDIRREDGWCGEWGMKRLCSSLRWWLGGKGDKELQSAWD